MQDSKTPNDFLCVSFFMLIFACGWRGERQQAVNTYEPGKGHSVVSKNPDAQPNYSQCSCSPKKERFWTTMCAARAGRAVWASFILKTL